jgi:ATP-dependent exoDNAse (exonuclease V) alpha subunit
MAIYHLNVGHVSRSTGRSSVQSAAYITGSSLYETRRDISANYENRAADIVWSQTIAPDWAPLEYHELSVWDKLESFEDEYAMERFPKSLEYREKYSDSARVAMTIVVALPRELSSDVSIELVKEFIDSRYTSQGLIVTAAMHDDEGNPHAHLQISRRAVNEDGSFSWAKNRSMCTKKELLSMRKVWADLTNRFLEREGFDIRITEKSFADSGVNLIPSKHRGWVSDKLEAMGVQSRIVDENQQIFKSNRERILENPEIILNEITSKQATFTQFDMLKVIQKRIGDDNECVSQVFEQALSCAVVLGDGIDGITRYTSTQYSEREEQALLHLEKIIGVERKLKSSHSVSPIHVDAYLADQFSHMSEEQHSATLGLLEDNQFAVLIGRAGTGKTTTTIKAVSAIYTKAGFNVLGTSLSALASENLGVEANITSKTIASWLSSWERLAEAEEKFLAFDAIVSEGVLKQFDWYTDLVRFRDLKLNDKSVLIVDEAGMIGTESWNRLLYYAFKAGAKVIAVGDDHQYKAIEAGDFFRELRDKAQQHNRLFKLTTIRRQRVEWMREASHNFAELNIQRGLSLYEQNGYLHQTDRAHLEIDIAHAYIEKLKEEKSGLVLAFSNAQVDGINAAIRSELRCHMIKGHTLSDKDVLFLESDQRNPLTQKPLQKGFAIGDKIVFLKNDKTCISIVDAHGECLPNQTIKNGTIGFLEKVTGAGDVVIRLVSDVEGSLRAHFNIKEYSHINHGYAYTSHKSQGQTVDFTLVAASKAMDAKSVYVTMTRHRDDVQLFYCKEDFADFKALSLQMSRFQNKDLAKDYTIRTENTDAWQRVQEYQHCVYDAAAILRELNAEGDSDLTPYLTIKKDQSALGREILMNYDAHKLYLNQASMTEEMIQISTGVKPRPLSIVEERAKMTVELYGESAKLSKELWHNVKQAIPSKSHPDYAKFQDVRLDRDDLAKRILVNYPLHREFIKSYAKEYFISKRTMENQVAYRE